MRFGEYPPPPFVTTADADDFAADSVTDGRHTTLTEGLKLINVIRCHWACTGIKEDTDMSGVDWYCPECTISKKGTLPAVSLTDSLLNGDSWMRR
jgi:hypothetical protein